MIREQLCQGQEASKSVCLTLRNIIASADVFTVFFIHRLMGFFQNNSQYEGHSFQILPEY